MTGHNNHHNLPFLDRAPEELILVLRHGKLVPPEGAREEAGWGMLRHIVPEDRPVVDAAAAELERGAEQNQTIVRLQTPEGEARLWVRLTLRAVAREEGRITVSCGVSDSTELIETRLALKKAHKELESAKDRILDMESTLRSLGAPRVERRQMDRMTGLLNRDPAEQEIGALLAQGGKGAFFFMDIDNFKMVNDLNGHPAGDQVLITFAQRLREVFTPPAVLARLGGDEFIAYLPDYQSIAQLRDLCDQTLLRGHGLVEDPLLDEKLGVSIGIALMPQDGTTFPLLYANADKGQYFVKRNGKNRYSFYGQVQDLPEHRELGADLNTLRRMVQSAQIDRGAFAVGYDGFTRVYQFLERNIPRTQRSTQIVLFSLVDGEGLESPPERVERERLRLGRAVRGRLRSGDLMMEFTQNQIAVLLVNCDSGNGERVAERVMSAYQQEPGMILRYEMGSINEVTE